jgi:diadenosine tetraphosphate (Ap4A) HIT family hydrolase
MNENCDACQFLQEPKNQILVTDHWSVGVGNNQAYFGRAYATLRTHKGSLSSLDEAEWQEFQEIVRRLEAAYKAVYGAEPLNWGCFMNNAYRVEPAHPHVHWHIFPRYKVAPTLHGVEYDDPLYGEFYDDNAERLVSDEVAQEIASKLVDYLKSH